MNVIEKSAGENNIERIKKVRIVVGKLNAALPHALEFAFDILSGERMLFKNAHLEIERRDVRIKCESCGKEYSSDDLVLRCPACSSSKIHLISGDELYIDSYEGDRRRQHSLDESTSGKENNRSQR